MTGRTAAVVSLEQQGRGRSTWPELFSLYRRLLLAGELRPDTFTFPILLRACPGLRAGEALHADAAKRGLVSSPSGADTFVSSALVDMYCCFAPSRDPALQLFDEMPEPNTVVWNAAISSFFHAGLCGGAQRLFDRMECPNSVTWSAMIAGYTQNGRPRDAILVFRKMRDELDFSRNVPNSHAISSTLSACVQRKDLTFGLQVHAYTTKVSNYVEEDEFVGSVLVDMYGRCGCTGLARQVFDHMSQKNVVAWSSLIANCVRDENPLLSIEVFKEMYHSGALPNDFTLTTVLSACARVPNLVMGKELHGFIVRRRLEGADTFISSALMDMYGKCGSVMYAHRVFERDGELLGLHVTPLWNAMLTGYVGNDCIEEAWGMIRCMSQLTNSVARLNSVTLAIIFPLCARSTLLLRGKEVHCYALKNSLDRELLVGNGLLDMYCKCGKINSARNQFDLMTEKNRISWTSLIDGYGMQGNVEDAIKFFQRMVGEHNVEPNPITFVALISACSHAGLVEEGLGFFRVMMEVHGIPPTEETCGCVVDLLARAGHIDEAKKFIAIMPIKPSASAWGALLGACRIHGEVNDAESTMECLRELEPKGSGFPTLLSNIYAERGKVDEVMKVRRAMAEMGIVKRSGCSWLETTKEGFQRFVVGNNILLSQRSRESK